eukprot:gene7165-7924_t
MDEITVNVDLRGFKTLLNALRAKLYPYSGEDVNDEDILSVLQQSQTELTLEELQNEISLFESIVKKAGTDHWSPEILQSFLEDRHFPTEYSTIFLEFWNKEYLKIHSFLLNYVTYNHRLDSVSWRVDMKVLSKSASEVNASVAYFDLAVQSRKEDNSDSTEKKVVKFEMNRQEVGVMLKVLDKIHDSYEKLIAASK